MHTAHTVTFTGDNDAQQYALVIEGNPKDQGTLKLVVWESPGWNEKSSVPHGSATQGYTWH